MHNFLRITILAAVLAASALAPLTGSANAAPRCYEDEPCWAWSTMGNLNRGVILKSKKYAGGYYRIVTPCDFAYLDMKGRIDWKRTDRLKGDGFARAHGCNPRMYAD